jgi:nucleotide-binding universal stress UspA family protein
VNAVVTQASEGEAHRRSHEAVGLAIRHMLFPTDFSEHAAAAWPYATGLAKEGGAVLHVLHVVVPPPIAASPNGSALVPANLADELLDQARASLEERARSARELGVEARTHATLGAASSEIVAYARDQRIGLIVMGTTGRTGLAHVLLGSVTERVVRQAPCPILAVRHSASPERTAPTAAALPQLRRILVPLDGSPLAEAALPGVVALARRHGAEIVLLRVAHALALPGPNLVEAQVSVVQEAEAYLAEVLRRLGAEGVLASSAVRYGRTPEEILDDIRVRRPDLVAMSTHGRTGLTHLLLGSVAEQVLRASPVPVLLFPARALRAAPAQTAAA